MSEGNLPKAYAFHEVESHWYACWEQEGSFHAGLDGSKPPFSIVIPPPNVTGQLHMGHALNNTLQDIVCRYKRLAGFEVLWVPGTDHAGIATQNVVERHLAAERQTRHQAGPGSFPAKRLGLEGEIRGHHHQSVEAAWEPPAIGNGERFTMDEGLSQAVRQVFVSLYQEGLIYRGKRMINWCPRCMTALANIEVEGEELDGHLYYVRYPVVGGKGAVVVATTRPETMLGDTAVAVHPEDPRYKAFIGQKVLLPLVERPLPVIADAYVDREFGTGALKITPAHDFNDFEVARKHELELLQVINEDGTMGAAAGPYAGLDRYACRKRIVKDLEKGGFLVKVEQLQTPRRPLLSLPECGGTHALPAVVCGDPPAGRRSPWRRCGKGRRRSFPPSGKKTTSSGWKTSKTGASADRSGGGTAFLPGTVNTAARSSSPRRIPPAVPSCGSDELEQDPDVLDTWFSSALWPFSTLGWPEETRELKRFYPTSVLVTAFDILFFWVARMMMMGLHFMKEVPFREVYVHALVRDSQGQKMSKSKGNVIDPLIMMDEYGTDALRFTLTALAVQGRDVKLSEERIEGYKHFINKIWNAARLVLMNLEGLKERAGTPSAKPEKLMHRWILSRLQRVVSEVREARGRIPFQSVCPCALPVRLA